MREVVVLSLLGLALFGAALVARPLAAALPRAAAQWRTAGWIEDHRGEAERVVWRWERGQ